MNTHTITIAAFMAALSLMASSCQKEEIVDSLTVSQEMSYDYTVMYSIDGVLQTDSFNGEEDWQAFLDRMFALAEAGYGVWFYNNANNMSSVATKEKVVYTTTDKNRAEQWAADMFNQGYYVSIEYDTSTGIYTCTAVR